MKRHIQTAKLVSNRFECIAGIAAVHCTKFDFFCCYFQRSRCWNIYYFPLFHCRFHECQCEPQSVRMASTTHVMSPMPEHSRSAYIIQMFFFFDAHVQRAATSILSPSFRTVPFTRSNINLHAVGVRCALGRYFSSIHLHGDMKVIKYIGEFCSNNWMYMPWWPCVRPADERC